MTARVGTRAPLALALLTYAAGLVVLVVAAHQGVPGVREQVVLVLAGLSPALLLGLLVSWRRRYSPVGPGLVALAAAPCLTWAVERWGTSYGTDHPMPAASAAAFVSGGVWVFNLAGFVLLCLVFPNGWLPGRRWRLLPWAFLAVAMTVVLVIGLDPVAYEDGGGPLPGTTPLPLSGPAFRVLDVLVGIALLAVLAGVVASLVVRYRRGTALDRVRLRWFVLGAGSVPVLLAGGWVAELAGAPVDIAYAGFLAAMLLVLPASVTVAILRHDLLDVDRLLSQTVSWVVTTVASAAVFAVVVLGVAQLSARADDRVGITAAAFVTALALLPLHRLVHTAVGRVLDRERAVLVAGMREFVRAVRDGRARPEEVQDALRIALGDPALQVLLRPPGATEYVDLSGRPAKVPAGGDLIPLSANDAEVGALVLQRPTARRRRQAREAVVEARLPIEVSRLAVELHRALDDAHASRARLVEAVADERRRLERDLHDGAQQQIVAVGMRLRAVQRSLPGAGVAQAELDAAVAALEDIVAELRRMAHGVRPSRLDEGLDAAIRDLVRDSPVPVDVRVEPAEISEVVATTAYYLVAECLANSLKHAAATRVGVTVTRTHDRLTIQVSDDGRGGAAAGFGLTAMRDRVAALGGRFDVDSPVGSGTTIRAEV